MSDTLAKKQFWDTFKVRIVVVTDLPPGRARDLANQVNETVGRGDASLRTGAEYAALFEALLGEPGSLAAPDVLRLSRNGTLTPAGQAVRDYLAASKGKDEFFDQDMYMIHVTGWPPDRFAPDDPVEAANGARLELWRTDPRDERHLAPADQGGVLLSTQTFSLMNSGNRTKHAPKRSWKVNFEVGGSTDRFIEMSRLNLKSMYNDPVSDARGAGMEPVRQGGCARSASHIREADD